LLARSLCSILNVNNLSGSIPSTIGNLTNLEYLYVERCTVVVVVVVVVVAAAVAVALTHRLPPCAWFRCLSGALENQLTGSIPPAVAQLTKLVVLDLHANLLTGVIPPLKSNFSSLSNLYASGLPLLRLVRSVPSNLACFGLTGISATTS
jgi:Leucine-rich repeat (LRR) protein